MKHAVRLSDYRAMDPKQQSQSLARLVRAARSAPNGELDELEALIASFEDEHGFDSETLRKKVSAGEIEETDAICAWLMLLKRRDHLGRLQARTSQT